jgi:glyoxylase-like metal-dependent hydrolase (beta-lactamase superfamily II)
MIKKIGKNIKAIFTEDSFAVCNCILVEDDVQLMIDSGAGTILPEVNTSAIDILINSHRHWDHIKGNDLMINAKILTHPIERVAMQDPTRLTAVSGWKELMDEDIVEEAKKLGGISERLLKPWKIDGEINDGQIIDCGSTKIEVLLTPGHTSGHCSFLFPDENLIFMVDICLTAAGPWYGEDQADIDDFVESINRIISLKPARIITSHRAEIFDQNIPEILGEYRDRILKREERILDCVRRNPSTINQIASQKIIYREHPIIFLLFWERYMVKKHLDHLIKQGLVEKLEDGCYSAKQASGVSP